MKHVKCYQQGYPRPQLVRKDWLDLNGEWLFAFGEDTTVSEALAGNLKRKIRVPYSYETEMSGIGDTSQHNTVWYSRTIEGKMKKKAILHFEGADYDTTVYINGTCVGSHRGAYSRFSFDVTEYLTQEKNILTVRCVDGNHPGQIRGKQRWRKESFGCWYVQTTGIWKSVWMEYVDEVYLTSLKMTPEIPIIPFGLILQSVRLPRMWKYTLIYSTTERKSVRHAFPLRTARIRCALGFRANN